MAKSGHGESNKETDECYTPVYAVKPLLKYVSKDMKIWCPFDKEWSAYVKIFRANGYNVICSHLEEGKDFFKYEPEEYDIIVSNPPYSIKFEVFERLFSLGKPFAMLVGVVGLFESQKRYNLFKENNFEIMYFNKRVSFFKDFNDPKPNLNPPFSSVYLTKDILPKQIIFEEIIK